MCLLTVLYSLQVQNLHSLLMMGAGYSCLLFCGILSTLVGLLVCLLTQVTVATLAMEEEIIWGVEDADIIVRLGGALVVGGAPVVVGGVPAVEEVLIISDPLPVSSYFYTFRVNFFAEVSMIPAISEVGSIQNEIFVVGYQWGSV